MDSSSCPGAAPCKTCGREEFVCCDEGMLRYTEEKPHNGYVGTLHENPVCVMCCTNHVVDDPTCRRCWRPVKRDGDLCAECQHEEAEARREDAHDDRPGRGRRLPRQT